MQINQDDSGATGATDEITEIEAFWPKGPLGQEGLRRLDDADALAAMRGAHEAYRRMKQAEADKEAAEAAIKSAADDLVKALGIWRAAQSAVAD